MFLQTFYKRSVCAQKMFLNHPYLKVSVHLKLKRLNSSYRMPLISLYGSDEVISDRPVSLQRLCV